MTLYLNSKACLDLKIHVPIKGQGVRTHFYQLHRNPELFLLFLKLIEAWQAGKIAPDLTPQQIENLLELGIFTTDPAQVVQDVAYQCLIGGGSIAVSAIDSQDWEVNPACCWQTTPEIPPAIAGGLLPGLVFGPHFPLLWVQDCCTHFWIPFWFTAEVLPLITDLLDGHLSPSDLPESLCLSLAQAGLLLPTEWQVRQQQWLYHLQQAQRSYQNHRYAVLRGLINPLQLKAIQIYCRALEREGYFTIGDHQVKRRKWIYTDPIMAFWQHQWAPVLSQIVGEPIEPTYTYLTIYQPGAELLRHRDREACQWNVSWHLDNHPSQVDCWPFYLDIGHQIFKAELQPGDAVLYRGVQDEHWREKLPEGQEATVCSLHYVQPGFTGNR